MKEQVRNVFSGNTVLAPNELRRYPLTFATGFTLTALAAGIAGFTALEMLPPYASPGAAGDIAAAAMKVIAYKFSGGLLFKNAAAEIIKGISASNAAPYIYAKAALSTVAGVAAGWFACRNSLVAHDGYKHIRGGKYHRPAVGQRVLSHTLDKGKMLFIHPAFKVKPHVWGNGGLVLGSPGSGKTTILLPYIREAVARGDKILTLDVKGEQIQKFPEMSFIAPWLHGSMWLDIGKDIKTEAQAAALANNLVKVDQSDKNKIWSSAANAVVGSLIYDLVKNKNQNWTWTDLAAQLDLTNEQWIEKLNAQSPALKKFLDASDSVQTSVSFSVIDSLKHLRTLAQMFDECKKFGGKPFSIHKWLHEKTYDKRQVILRFDESYRAAIEFLYPFLIDYIATQISSLENSTDDPKQIVLDEFAQLPVIRTLTTIYETGRSKGFLMIIGTQDWAQVKQRYGADGANVLYSTSSIKVICRTTQSHAQDEIAKLLGTRDVSTDHVSLSSSGFGVKNSSMSQQEKTMPLVLPTQLSSDLGPQRRGGEKETKPFSIRALLVPMNGDIYCMDWPLVDMPEVRKAPAILPSHHSETERIRAILRGKKSLEENLREAISKIKEQKMKVSYSQLLALIYSDGKITEADYTKSKADAKAYFASLNAAEASNNNNKEKAMNEEEKKAMEGVRLYQEEERILKAEAKAQKRYFAENGHWPEDKSGLTEDEITEGIEKQKKMDKYFAQRKKDENKGSDERKEQYRLDLQKKIDERKAAQEKNSAGEE